jgi:hypothetical protein
MSATAPIGYVASGPNLTPDTSASTRTTSKFNAASLMVWHQRNIWGNPALALPDRKTFSFPLSGGP